MRFLPLLIVLAVLPAGAAEHSPVAAAAPAPAVAPAAAPAAVQAEAATVRATSASEAAPIAAAVPAVPAVPAGPAGPASVATEAPAAAAEEFKAPSGYQKKSRGGSTVYCRSQTRVGTRFPSEYCYTQADLQRIEKNKKSMQEDVSLRTRMCTTGTACSGGG
ncbi:MAG: hypothetical protein MUD07_01440 [Burkholderiaceae bacterium]|jgi:hypothetical protein|nr:hypothetical protein [Burkholderiaceae bacterium]